MSIETNPHVSQAATDLKRLYGIPVAASLPILSKLASELYNTGLRFGRRGGAVEAASQGQPVRASDGRPDCPYNGAAPVEDVPRKYGRGSFLDRPLGAGRSLYDAREAAGGTSGPAA